jgi:uncharacterized membrane protein
VAEKANNLDQPRGTGGSTGYDADTFGRWAEAVARLFGTGRFLVAQTVIVVLWIALNAISWALRFDAYPFILLNLMFSTQAAYAAPLILLAQNRQADRDKEEIERDRQTVGRSLAETEFLARELAQIRLSLEQTASRDDLLAGIDQLTESIERVTGVSLREEEIRSASAGQAAGGPAPGHSADSSHQ